MQIHVVQSGQTLYSISRQYGLSAGILARLNGLIEPYQLAVGQSLFILQPQSLYTVQPGDTLYSVSEQTGIPILDLLRRNPNLAVQPRLYPDQVIILTLEQNRQKETSVFGYAYANAADNVLQAIMPYASDLMPFTYGFTADGQLVPMRDERLIGIANTYGVRPVMHLSTLTESGTFSAERARVVLGSEQLQQRLIENVIGQMQARGYEGLDIDFEFLGAELAQPYASFLGRMRERVNALGYPLLAAVAPKTRADQPGILYAGHDYGLIGQNTDGVLVMTYEWGYTYGPPMAVAPIDAVRRVLDYAVSEIAPEKLFMGFPNYAYDWALPFVAGTTRAQLIGNEYAPRLAAQVRAEIEYDEQSKTPYFHYTDPNGVMHEVWFEDVRSSLAKFELMIEYGLRGFGYWNFMRPFTANFYLLDSMFTIVPGV